MAEQNNTPDQMTIYEEIKEQVRQRFERRTQLAGNLMGLIGYVIVAPFLFQYESGLFSTQVGFIIGALWLGGLLIHAVNVAFAEMRDRALQNELERVGLLPARTREEKAKHDEQYTGGERLVRLTDEGELIDVAYDYDDDYDENNRQTK